MRKGIILEINEFHLTLLTPEGEFLRARKLQREYQLGDEIHFFPEMAEEKRKKFNLSFINSFKAKTAVSSAAFLLFLMAFLPFYQNSQVYAYMSIDVNPSIELAVNEELKVLQLKGYNQEGKDIIAEIVDWKKKDAAFVAEMILQKMEEEGFFQSRDDVVIATVPNGKVNEEVEKQLEKEIAELKKTTEKEDLDLKVITGTAEEREEAQGLGLTTGVYKAKLDKENKAVQGLDPGNDISNKKEDIGTSSENSKKQAAPGQVKKSIQQSPKEEAVKNASDNNKNGNGKPNQNRQNNKEKKDAKSNNGINKRDEEQRGNSHGNNAKEHPVKNADSSDNNHKHKMKRVKQDNIGHIGNGDGNSNKKSKEKNKEKSNNGNGRKNSNKNK